MDFQQYLQQYSQEHIQQSVDQIQPQDIDRALQLKKLRLDDFMALLSPQMSQTQLEQLAQRSQQITRQRFGYNMQMYAPLYLSNECHNGCRYCGFNAENRDLHRKTLNDEEILREAQYLRKQGFQHILLLTGEAPKAAGVDYIEHAVQLLRGQFSSLSIEVFPMSTEDYARLENAGVDGLTIYQETYDRELYAEMHPFGAKRDFNYRLAAPERGGLAGFRRIGIGALLGLGNFYYEAFCTGLHARYLMRRFWRTQVSLSFPRMRPAEGGFQPRTEVNDRQLTQLICALRLLLPDAGLVLSTRESAQLRNHLIPLGVTQVSSGSCTAPGGYEGDEKQGEQFSIDDERSPQQVEQMLKENGFEAVWKDWDGALTQQQGI